MSEVVLLVEDDPADVLMVRRAFSLSRLPGAIQVVHDGEEAMRYLSGEGPYGDRALHPVPSLILLDLKLPRRSGLEVVSWLRAQPLLRRLPVIMLTSSDQPKDVVAAYEAGANAYHVKPPGVEEVVRTIQALHEYWLTRVTRPDLR
jgi:DNA-binding response OmpR family regulator